MKNEMTVSHHHDNGGLTFTGRSVDGALSIDVNLQRYDSTMSCSFALHSQEDIENLEKIIAFLKDKTNKW